ncbi:AC3_0185 family rSAM-modified Cys-rich RiPP [Clostridium botulinum]|uniref:AC3_0185 family rSAM-modified Cys-rich RiPP n=1 Tax=Clostridium botulinum TaxID=1491 RepID=UPI000AD2DA02|nr:AC3_0185 family rSAM-modified Cys-rich RiPP [Clostridium botulinum]
MNYLFSKKITKERSDVKGYGCQGCWGICTSCDLACSGACGYNCIGGCKGGCYKTSSN